MKYVYALGFYKHICICILIIDLYIYISVVSQVTSPRKVEELVGGFHFIAGKVANYTRLEILSPTDIYYIYICVCICIYNYMYIYIYLF